MGILNSVGGRLGQAFAPAQTAQAAAEASLRYGTLATGINVASQLAAGVGGMQQAQFQAKLAGQNAQAALLAGQSAESASKMRYGALKAEQVVAQAANGVQVGEGSAARTIASTDLISNMDAAMIHYNAARQAYGEMEQAKVYKAAGKGALAKGVMGAGVSFLSGAQSLSDKWQSYKLSGALTAPKGAY